MPEVHFLPWAEIRQDLSIGPVNVSPWVKVRNTLSSAERQFLDTYFERHITHDGRPVKNIALVWLGSKATIELNAQKRNLLRRAVDALVFSAITANLRNIVRTANPTFGVPNSERFQLVTQRFNATDPSIAVRSGGTLHSWGLKEIHFCIPWYAGSSIYIPNQDLLTALGKLLTRRRGLKQREQIFRALEWFRFAHSGIDEISEQSRIVMMATAFEVLLEPTNQKRFEMTQALHNLTMLENLRKKTINIGKKNVKVNAVAVWLDSYYQIRNAIVHGDQVKPSRLNYPVQGRPWLTHFHVAALVLWEAVSWNLVKDRLLGKEAREHANWCCRLFGEKTANEEFVRIVMSGLIGINTDEYHEDLGWTKPRHSSRS